MKYEYTDGGKAAAGYGAAQSGDCAARAISIATEKGYGWAVERIMHYAKKERRTRKKTKISSPFKGVYRGTMEKVLSDAGFEWVKVRSIGQGCTVHLNEGELPSKGRYVLRLSRHYAAWIDGVLYDNHDCSREGTRTVYGYWREKPDVSEYVRKRAVRL